jgi:hypothetical protein
VRAVFEKSLRLCSKNHMKMDINPFETIKNGKFGKFYIKNVLFEYKISCLDIFGGDFVNLTLFWPKNSRKILNGVDQKGDVLDKNVI